MKNNVHPLGTLFSLLTLLVLVFPSCDDGYYMDDHGPEWLGESIYNYLETQGNFTCYTRMIDQLGYKDVLSKTGSKTLFVADDEAFNRFFENGNNLFGARKFEDLSLAQMDLILYSSMINNAQLIELLANTEGPNRGRCLRRSTALSVLDTIPLEPGVNLPSTHYWDRFRANGVRLAKDDTPTSMVHLLPDYMKNQKISESDFCYLTNRDSLVENGAYVNGQLVIKRDITCRNGYVHQLENVALPLQNMAEILRTAPETQLFSRFVERFSAPYYSGSLSREYNRVHGLTDSVFVKRYFSANSKGAALTSDPDSNVVTGYLTFDPGWNAYAPSGGTMSEDMGVIFAPTDEAVEKYFKAGGKFLIDRFGSMENIPDKLMDDLVNNHMKFSFLNSVPSRFYNVMNDAQIPMNVTAEDINKVYFGSNGIVYVMNSIYPPVSYVAVSSPALINENMKVINWAIEKLQFNAYLLSMDSYFSFVIPTDSALKHYVDPVSMGKTIKHCFEFRFNEKTQAVEADIRAYDPETGLKGTFVRVATEKEILNRLENLLDYHTVVGDIEDGRTFYRTKGGGSIKVTGTGVGMSIQGGSQVTNQVKPTVKTIYDQTVEGNGKAYILDDYPLQAGVQSVYSILKNRPEFKAFFELLAPDDSTGYIESKKLNIFESKASNVGLDLNVKFFNTYHYTVYVPTNEAIAKAIQDGLPTWEKILSEGDVAVRDSMAQILITFLRYHFQDNSVFIDGGVTNSKYETAAVNAATNRFYKLWVNTDQNHLYVNDNGGNTVQVATANPALYNIMAHDYLFNGSDRQVVTAIETSSWAVIHQINDVLLYDSILPGRK